MGRVFRQHLNHSLIYQCKACQTHLTCADSIISKSFQGRSGKAYLFDHVINITQGPFETRILMTGSHVVADIYCNTCLMALGWRYEKAEEESQKYKEGKFILEIAKTDKTIRVVDDDGEREGERESL